MNANRSSGVPVLLAGLGGFLTGLGAGISLALLFAPLSGSDTRQRIGAKVKEGEGWIKDKAAAAEDYVLSHGTELRSRAREVAEVISRK